MRVSWFLFLLLLVSGGVSGQSVKKKCNCSLLLKEAMQKVSTIYAGFDDKVTPATQLEYNKLVTAVSIEASSTDNERRCFDTIEKYTNWFKDHHLGVWFGIQSSADSIPKVSLSEVTNTNPLKSGDELEGIWSTADKSEQYAIIKDKSLKNKYIAVTIKNSDSAWVPGMIKVEFYNYDSSQKLYRGMYYQKTFSGVLNGFTVNNDRIDHWFGPSWYRNKNDSHQQDPKLKIEETVLLKLINQDFVYLKLGRFNQIDVDKLDSLVRANRKTIQNTKNLIIDLRGNPGGNSGSSQEMIRLIYTNPIIYPAWKYRSSPELIRAKKEVVVKLSKNDPDKRIESQQSLLKRLIDYPGQLVNGGDSVVRTVDSVSHYPERVALLVDKGSGSSSEFFVFEGKQSKKVTLFGENTAGVMDYGEVQNLNLSCGQYMISIPWGRNGWIERFGFRIDNIGFVPDVPITSTEPDWVQFIVDYWSGITNRFHCRLSTRQSLACHRHHLLHRRIKNH